MYLCIMSLLNLFSAVTTFPLLVAAFIIGSWEFGDVGCTFCGFILTTFGLTNIMLITVLAIKNYRVIVCDDQTENVVNICLFIGIILTLCWAISPLCGWNRYVQPHLFIIMHLCII